MGRLPFEIFKYLIFKNLQKWATNNLRDDPNTAIEAYACAHFCFFTCVHVRCTRETYKSMRKRYFLIR